MKRILFLAVISVVGLVVIGGISNNAFGQSGQLNGHEYVDLGLPSGLMWATCNVGANAPEDYGDYFAWGETVPKEKYTEENYKYTENLTILSSDNDAATANWGNGWRMPTKAEFDELLNNCTVTWTAQNGVNGRLFKGPNGNSIFLPAAGTRLNAETYNLDNDLFNAGDYGYYRTNWLKISIPNYAWFLGIKSDNCEMFFFNRSDGMSVRPVCPSQNKPAKFVNEPTGYANGYGYVDLGLSSGTKWATCNVGATSPEEFGDYFAWGETKSKNSYTEKNYKYSGKSSTLPAKADAATVNWGKEWRMPTFTECWELIENCVWVSMPNGYKVIGPNGNSIFIPFVGIPFDGDYSYGVYWTGTIVSDLKNSAWYMFLHTDFFYSMGSFDDNRYGGHSVRAVVAK